MSERGLPVGVSGFVDFTALELSALFRPGLDRLRELGGMRRPGVDRQAHAVLAGHEAPPIGRRSARDKGSSDDLFGVSRC